jgi:hypothetical protein
LRGLLHDRAGMIARGASAREYAQENYSAEAVGLRWLNALGGVRP